MFCLGNRKKIVDLDIVKMTITHFEYSLLQPKFVLKLKEVISQKFF